MGILESQQLDKIEQPRKDTIDREGTAPLIFLNPGDIDVDASKGGNIIDFVAEGLTAKYIPFDLIQINNSSNSDLNIYINQNTNWQKLVRAGTIVKITDFKGIRSVRISKRDGAITIAAGEVETTVMRQSLTDDEYRRRQTSRSPLSKMFDRFKGFIGG